MKNVNKKNKDNNIFINLEISFLIAFSLGFFEPFYIYLSNSSEFWYGPKVLIPIILLVSGTVFVFSFLVLQLSAIAFKRVQSIIVAIVAWVILGLFVQGNYIPDKNGSMDGAIIDWSVVNSGMILSYMLWAAIIIVLIWGCLAKKMTFFKNSTQYISIGVITAEIISLGVLLMMSDSFNDKNKYAVTDEGVNDFSNQNVVVFILDDFDSQEMQERLDDDLAGELEDFTFFPDTMSVYGHTDLSIPQIVSGINYYNEQDYGEYLKKAYDESPLMEYLRNEDWNVGIYTETIVPAGDTADHAVNCLDIKTEISSKRRFIKYNYKLVAYYCAPYFMKKYFWFYPDVINDTQGIAEDGYERFSWELSEFYKNLNIDVCVEAPVFKMYHLKGLHSPYDTDADLNKVDYQTSINESFGGNMLLLDTFLNQLKQKGVYDNTVVVVMSDHGESADITGEWKQNPLFMIKGVGEKHNFEISDNRISYGNIQEIFMRLIEGEDAEDATSILEKDAERIFLRYDFDMNEIEKKESSFFRPIYEYRSSGDAKDMTAFEYADNRYAHK